MKVTHPDLAEWRQAMAEIPKAHQLAAIRATNTVVRATRTAMVKQVRQQLNISAKSVRKRTAITRMNRRNGAARIWMGTRTGVPLYEGGTLNRGVRALAGPRSFEQTMKSGHRGLFYREGRTWIPGTRPPKRARILEHRISLRGTVAKLVPDIQRDLWVTRYEHLYRKDLAFRLRRAGWH